VQRSGVWQVDHVLSQAVQETNVRVKALLRRANLLTSSWREARDSLQHHHERLARTPSILPTDGHISSAFSRWRFHPILNYARAHRGIDISARTGTPIVAAARGRVDFAGRTGDYGLLVEIDHGFDILTRYAHTSKVFVRAGQIVERGDTIALVGSTGLAVGPHLHYEVLVSGHAVNPRQFLMGSNAIAD
ncbi:MAG: M23 family metallopeptidase, partial [Longimicrobiales bacterium]